jgi:superfamily I DNA/RNA helicase
VRRHENEEIGVLVHHEATRRKLFNKIGYHLKKKIPVQTYSSRDASAKDAGSLQFDVPGVTVLCFASSKGLEFDTVFLPEIQSSPIDPENRDIARMNLYVMTSRARNALYVMVTDPGRTCEFWKLLRPLDSDRSQPLYEIEV